MSLCHLICTDVVVVVVVNVVVVVVNVVVVVVVVVVFVSEIKQCDSKPCQNGGTCVEDTTGYTCTCASGYTGTNCQTGKVTHSGIVLIISFHYFYKIMSSLSSRQGPLDEKEQLYLFLFLFLLFCKRTS